MVRGRGLRSPKRLHLLVLSMRSRPWSAASPPSTPWVPLRAASLPPLPLAPPPPLVLEEPQQPLAAPLEGAEVPSEGRQGDVATSRRLREDI